MRIIAIDYGAKRTGLATTDPMQIIATHLGAIDTKDLLDYLKTYCSKEEVEGFVIGRPLTLQNNLNPIYSQIINLKDKLKLHFSEKYIEEIDERFTSKMASASILMSGVNKKKRQDKKTVDAVSAVIILQNYLDLKSNLK
ncbi:MAG: Holliday junction resolvase RuvX [Chitinophagales bacterium]